MQVKNYVVPDGDAASLEEMNAFLRGQRVLGVDVAYNNARGYWTYSIRFLPFGADSKRREKSKEKKDYKMELGEAFDYYTELRIRRKAIATRHSVPVYVVFTNEELAGIARLGEEATLKDLSGIVGIGKGKVAKYGALILAKLTDDAES